MRRRKPGPVFLDPPKPKKLPPAVVKERLRRQEAIALAPKKERVRYGCGHESDAPWRLRCHWCEQEYLEQMAERATQDAVERAKSMSVMEIPTGDGTVMRFNLGPKRPKRRR